MGKVKLKYYKFSLLSGRTIFRKIREDTWSLMDKLSQDRKLQGKMLQARVELEHLILTETANKPDHNIAARRIKELVDELRRSYSDLYHNLRQEIKKAEDIDYKGQTLAFRQLKAARQFEKWALKKLEELRRKELGKEKNTKHKSEIKQKYELELAKIKEAFSMLDLKLSSTLKSIWEMAKRQTIHGIETEVIFSTQSEQKLLREIKIGAKNTKNLLLEERQKLSDLKKAKTVEEFSGAFIELLRLYSEGLHEIRHMLEEHRRFIFDLTGKFRQLEQLAKSVKLDPQKAQNLDMALKEGLAELETLYSWLFHETRKVPWVQQIEELQQHHKGERDIPKAA